MALLAVFVLQLLLHGSDAAMPRANAKAHAKLLRSISGIAGVSDNTLSTVLQWVQEHPEVADGNVSHEAVRTSPHINACSGVDRLSVAPPS